MLYLSFELKFQNTGNYEIEFSYVSYLTKTIKLNLSQDTFLEIKFLSTKSSLVRLLIEERKNSIPPIPHPILKV